MRKRNQKSTTSASIFFFKELKPNRTAKLRILKIYIMSARLRGEDEVEPVWTREGVSIFRDFVRMSFVDGP